MIRSRFIGYGALLLGLLGCDDVQELLDENLSVDATTHVFEIDASGGLTQRTSLEEDVANGSDATLPDGRFALMGLSGLTPENRRFDNVRIYDPATNAWSEGASWPTPRGHVEWVRYGDEICAGSGIVSADLEDYVDHVDCYDAATDTWRDLPSSPVRSSHMVALEDKLYAFDTDRKEGKGTTAAAVYDPATDAWSAIADKPVCDAGDPVAYDGRIYLVGCEDGGNVVYDVATDSWTKTTASYSPRGKPHRTAFHDGVIYVAYGDLHAFDISAMSWSTTALDNGSGAVDVASSASGVHALDLVSDITQYRIYSRDDGGDWLAGELVPDLPGPDPFPRLVATNDAVFVVITSISSVGLN